MKVGAEYLLDADRELVTKLRVSTILVNSNFSSVKWQVVKHGNHVFSLIDSDFGVSVMRISRFEKRLFMLENKLQAIQNKLTTLM